MSSDQETRSVPECALLVMCGECGRGTEVPLPVDQTALALFLARGGWFMAVLTPPGQAPVLFGALCGDCALGVFPPEVLRAAEEHRQRLLQDTTRSGDAP
jgi:hypothetical protein